MKKVPARSGVTNLTMPSTERRKALRVDPASANTPDEEIWLTRSRISSLNGVINSIIIIDNEKKFLRQVAPGLAWGVFGQTLNKATEKSLKINKKTIDDAGNTAAVMMSFSSYDDHAITLDEDYGFYHAWVKRNGDFLGGLSTLSEASTAASLLAVFAIHGLNQKLEMQLRNFARDDLSPLSDREHMLARLSGRVPNEELE